MCVCRSKGRAANIQLEAFNGSLSVHRNTSNDTRDVEIKSQVSLRNYGGAPASLVNISWEVLDPMGLFEKKSARLVVSDSEPQAGEVLDSNKIDQGEPLVWLDTLFPSGEARPLWVILRRKSQGRETVSPARIRIKFVFSNGQELTFVPDLTKYEFSESLK